jgi:hypothetical protein
MEFTLHVGGDTLHTGILKQPSGGSFHKKEASKRVQPRALDAYHFNQPAIHIVAVSFPVNHSCGQLRRFVRSDNIRRAME